MRGIGMFPGFEGRYRDCVKRFREEAERAQDRGRCSGRPYLSMDGTAECMAMSVIADEAFPENDFPRVVCDLGFHNEGLLAWARKMREKDGRFVIADADEIFGALKDELRRNGYPVWSTSHTNALQDARGAKQQKGAYVKYMSKGKCPEELLDEFDPKRKLPFKPYMWCCSRRKHAERFVAGNPRALTIMAWNEKRVANPKQTMYCFAPDERAFAREIAHRLKLPTAPLDGRGLMDAGRCAGCPLDADYRHAHAVLSEEDPGHFGRLMEAFAPVWEEYRRKGLL